MAKKDKAQPKKAGAAKTVAAAPSDVMQMISEAKFKRLVSAVKGAEADKNEAVGRSGSLISQAVEKERLDKKAFGMFRSLNGMSDNRLATTLACLDYYRDIGGLDARAAKQEQMFARTEAGEVEEDGEEVEMDVAPDPKTTAPRPGSFAEKVRKANGTDPVKEARTLHDKRQEPSPEQIKEIADRAEATGRPH